ncbi:MAG: hypothetical protein ACI4V2_02900 [Alloprevotella sp.]
MRRNNGLKRMCGAILAFAIATAMMAQTAKPFVGRFFCREAGITLVLNAYEETVEVPGMSFVGTTFGYLSGRGIYGLWLVWQTETDDNAATLHFTSDTGGEHQKAKITMIDATHLELQTVGSVAFKKAVGRKWVKLDGKLTFEKQKD